MFRAELGGNLQSMVNNGNVFGFVDSESLLVENESSQISRDSHLDGEWECAFTAFGQ
jgi:hypothetical protein